MKKYTFIYFLILFSIIVNSAICQEFGSWVIPPYRIDFPNSGPEANIQFVEPNQNYVASDAAIKHNGEVLFYVIDENSSLQIYGSNNQLIDNISKPGALYQLKIVPLPGQNLKFYIIWGEQNTSGGGSVNYSVIDCTSGVPNLISTVEIISTTGWAGLALSKTSSGINYIYIALTGKVSKYLIQQSGINYVNDVITENDPIYGDGFYYDAHNLEIRDDASAMAWCSFSDPEKLFVVNLDEQGNLQGSASYNLNSGAIMGIEFGDIAGNNIIYASCTDFGTSSIQQVDYNNGQIGTPLITGNYGMTFLEKAADGYIYAVSDDGSNLGQIDPLLNSFTANVLSDLNIQSSDAQNLGSFLYKLPDNQIHYSTVDLFLDATCESCPGSADGSITAVPQWGTPPYTYLWSPGGQTSQTIYNLSVGNYSCCVTDALEDTDCETIEVTYPPGLFDLETITLNSSTPYINWDKKIEKELVITGNDVTLIDCDLQFGKYGKIIVEQGAKLTLSNCTVSNLEECGSMWQGIEVWGVEWTHQYSISGVNAQGQLILENNTIIENAICAVELWRPPDHWSTTGGIIVANDAIFRNNAKSLHAYAYHNIYLNKEMDNVSHINDCSFEIDGNYIADVEFFKHIDLNDVKGIKFSGCDFSVSDVPGVAQWPIGIASYSAGFHVLAPCISTHNPCNEYDHCTFNGFTYAIYASNLLSTYTFNVSRAIFENNVFGIKAEGVNFPTVLFSNFVLGLTTGDGEECEDEEKLAPNVGIHLTNCSGFTIEENKFSKIPAPLGYYYGIHLNSCPSFSDDIYLNEFYGLSMGIVAEGYNRSNSQNDHTGVSYICNRHYYNAFDYHVMNNSMIRGNVGTTTSPAGNILTDPAISIVQLQNSYTQDINYYYNSDEEAMDEWLVEYSDFVYTYDIDYENTCPSHFEGTGGGGGDTDRGIVLDPEQKAEEELLYYQSMNDLNSVQNLYESLKDGGNTEALQTEIETSWPDDMWELRADLLGKSPHLSKEVLMTAADKTDVLPESVIFEILSANPDELREEELISFLENKEQPLPEYMIDILKQLANGITYKTILQNQMSDLYHNKVNAAKNMVRSELNDTITDLSVFRNWMDNIGGMIADKQIISSYVQEGDYVSAQSLLNILPALYGLNGTELEDYNEFQALTDLQIDLLMQNRNMFELDSVELSTVQDIAQNGTGRSKFDARGILEYFYGYHYCNCMNLPDSAALKTAAINFGDLQQSTGISIQAEPNPASTWVAFNYSLPFDGSGAVIKIFDNMGKKIDEKAVADRQGQFIWDVRKIKPGVYLYKLECNGLSEKGKLIIK